MGKTHIVNWALAPVAGIALCCVVAPAAFAAVPSLYVVDHPANGDFVRRYNGATGASINANYVSLLFATGVTVGPDGNVYVGTSDASTSTPPGSVYRYNPATGTQIDAGPFVLYHGQPPTPDPNDVIIPQGMTFGPDNNLYVADQGGNQNVHQFTSAGASVTTFSPGGDPASVAFHNGNLYTATSNGVEKYDSAGHTFSTTVLASSPAPSNPLDIAFGPGDAKLYVLDGGSSPSVLRYNADGTGGSTFTDFPGIIFQPAAMAFGPDAELYVSGIDLLASQGEVLRFHSDGSFHDVFATGLDNPGFLAFTPVPEPAGLMLGLCGGIGLLLRGRKRQR